MSVKALLHVNCQRFIVIYLFEEKYESILSVYRKGNTLTAANLYVQEIESAVPMKVRLN